MLLNNSCAVRFAIPFLCDISISDSGAPPSRSGKGRKSSFVSSPRDGFLRSPPRLLSLSLFFSLCPSPFSSPLVASPLPFSQPYLPLPRACDHTRHPYTYKRIPDINLPTSAPHSVAARGTRLGTSRRYIYIRRYFRQFSEPLFGVTPYDKVIDVCSAINTAAGQLLLPARLSSSLSYRSA